MLGGFAGHNVDRRLWVGLPPFAKALSNGEVAPEAGIFEPQNLRQSAVAFYVGG